jgi:hypothetical protein
VMLGVPNSGSHHTASCAYVSFSRARGLSLPQSVHMRLQNFAEVSPERKGLRWFTLLTTS